MKHSFARGLPALALTLFSAVALYSQDCSQSGPWAPVGQEKPPLSDVELSTPLVVKDISGIVYYGEGKPLQVASFVLVRDGVPYCQYTGRDGRFEVRALRGLWPVTYSSAVPPGTYRFQVTKDGFHPTVGTVIVSHKAPKQSVMKVELKPAEGYLVEREKELVPNEQLLPVRNTNPDTGTSNPQKYRYSNVDMPVSLAVGAVRTPEFFVNREAYYIMMQADKRVSALSFEDMRCMMGMTSNQLELADCKPGNKEPLLLANWTVWDGDRIVAWGSNSTQNHAKYTAEHLFKFLGMFLAEGGKKYVVQVRFVKDGTPLNVTNPHLIVTSVRNH